MSLVALAALLGATAGCVAEVNVIALRDTGTGTLDGTADAPTGVTCGAMVCAPGQACCAATGGCYDPRCLACCMPGPDRDAGALESGTGETGPAGCRTSSDCNFGGGGAPARVCVFATAGCEVTTGVCQAVNVGCMAPAQEYCSCTGVTVFVNCSQPEVPWRAVGPCAGIDGGVGSTEAGFADTSVSSSDASIVDTGGATEGGVAIEAGPTCTGPGTCPPGQECCDHGPRTGSCYDPRCLSCCM